MINRTAGFFVLAAIVGACLSPALAGQAGRNAKAAGKQAPKAAKPARASRNSDEAEKDRGLS